MDAVLLEFQLFQSLRVTTIRGGKGERKNHASR